MGRFKTGDRVVCTQGYRDVLYTGGKYTVIQVHDRINAISIIAEDGEEDLFGDARFELDKNSIVGDIIRDL